MKSVSTLPCIQRPCRPAPRQRSKPAAPPRLPGGPKTSRPTPSAWRPRRPGWPSSKRCVCASKMRMPTKTSSPSKNTQLAETSFTAICEYTKNYAIRKQLYNTSSNHSQTPQVASPDIFKRPWREENGFPPRRFLLDPRFEDRRLFLENFLFFDLRLEDLRLVLEPPFNSVWFPELFNS